MPYLLLRKSPTRWWLYSALALVPFIIVGNLIAPIWIAPLFNRFGPMQDKALEARILALADRAGIEGGRVFEVEKSVDTKTLNAYVAGVFNTKRIVLWDTIITRMGERELLFVMGHEMAHFVLGHTWQLIVLNTVLLIGSFYAAYRMADAVLRRFGDRFGFTRMDDIASLPLLLLLVSVFSLVVTPAILAVTRHMEHEADRFGLEITQTTTARRRRSSSCRATRWPCHVRGCSTSSGDRATRRSASASTSPTSTTHGARRPRSSTAIASNPDPAVHRPDRRARLRRHRPSGCQCCSSVIGASTSSMTVLIRNRPSGATSYCRP